jgi:hypothetical protein
LLLALERKGKTENTIIAVRKNLIALGKRADLDKPDDVVLAIARYKKVNGQPASNNYKSKMTDRYQHYCKFKRAVLEGKWLVQ